MIMRNIAFALLCLLLCSRSIAQTTDSTDAAEEFVVTAYKGLSLQDWEEIRQWRASRGYTIRDQKYKSYLYKFYPDITLEKLMQKGDGWATRTLARRAKGRAKKIAVYERAITYGSTSHIYSVLIWKGLLDLDTTEENKRTRYIEWSAWSEFARLRGDRCMHYSYDEKYIQLTADEIQQIHNKAAALYKDFSARRAELGLGEFDNTEPQSVKLWVDRVWSGVHLRKNSGI